MIAKLFLLLLAIASPVESNKRRSLSSGKMGGSHAPSPFGSKSGKSGGKSHSKGSSVPVASPVSDDGIRGGDDFFRGGDDNLDDDFSNDTDDSNDMDDVVGDDGLRGGDDDNTGGCSLDNEVVCDMLQAFERNGRDENQLGDMPDWPPLCDDFESIDKYVCPSSFEQICSHSRPHLNPAVRINYCEPLFAGMEDLDRRDECTHFCINFVSQDRGGCCDIQCPP